MEGGKEEGREGRRKGGRERDGRGGGSQEGGRDRWREERRERGSRRSRVGQTEGGKWRGKDQYFFLLLAKISIDVHVCYILMYMY